MSTKLESAEKPSSEGAKVGVTIYDPKTRLDVKGGDPNYKYRWVRHDNVDRRRMMGYDVVQDANSTSGVKTFTGRKDGTMHSTHDMVLMATRKENADAYLKRAADKSKARMKRDMEGARESLNRATGGKGRGYFFGDAKTE